MSPGYVCNLLTQHITECALVYVHIAVCAFLYHLAKCMGRLSIAC